MLRQGSHGDLVVQLQSDLNRIRPARYTRLATDGIFGAKSDQRVRE
jgi:peptidoglycan hydrolase-like protein with peptidoglycan-binding domain